MTTSDLVGVRVRLVAILGACLAAIAGCTQAGCPPGYERVGDLCAALTDAQSVDGAASDAGHDSALDAHVPCGGSCTAPSPLCLAETCVQCVASTDCSGSTPLCETTSHACVGCLASTDCPATAALCDASTHACVPCTANSDCEHLTGRGICSGGACVQCTIRNEAPCGANSCDPATGSCTTTPTHSRTNCQACVADSECSVAQRCVPMSFQGVARPGGFCLTPSTAGCGTCGTLTDARVSLSGETAATYCGVPEMYATCESYLDNGVSGTCTMDSDCGAVGLDDARCTAGHQCFTGCSMTCQCPGGFGYTCRTDHFCG